MSSPPSASSTTAASLSGHVELGGKAVRKYNPELSDEEVFERDAGSRFAKNEEERQLWLSGTLNEFADTIQVDNNGTYWQIRADSHLFPPFWIGVRLTNVQVRQLAAKTSTNENDLSTGVKINLSGGRVSVSGSAFKASLFPGGRIVVVEEESESRVVIDLTAAGHWEYICKRSEVL